MNIVPLEPGERLADFVEVAWTAVPREPGWIPPLREQVFYELSGASAFSKYGRTQLFLCEADGRIVGRIAALVNPRLVDQKGQVVGQLGYFECADDTRAASALVDAGLEWLGAQGAREIVAPINGGAHRTHRFMTRGFERDPYLFEPRNPPYYPRLLEHCGFLATHRWYGYELSAARGAARLQKLERVLAKKPPPGRVEELQTSRADETIPRVHRLLDGCWTGHVGYAPLDLDEFSEVFRGALSIMGPGHVSVFVQDGRDVGLAFVLPDYAAEMRALGGRAAGWGQWLGTARPRRLILHTTALLPAVRQTSAAMAQVAWALRRGVEGGFGELVVALAVEGFVTRIGEQTREYALYSRRAG